MAAAFGAFQLELDARHDRNERIVKLSRDVTIESKRLIFLLHRITTEPDRKALLEQVYGRLEALRTGRWSELAAELEGQDPYLFLRAYTPGLQEYVEALALFFVLAEDRILAWHEVSLLLTFLAPPKAAEKGIVAAEAGPESPMAETSPESKAETGPESAKIGEEAGPMSPQATANYRTVTVPRADFVLGLGDLGGELMRYAINAISAGDLAAPAAVAALLRALVEALSRLGKAIGGKDFHQKLSTLQASRDKVERALYALRLRTSELPDSKVPAALLASLASDAANQPPPPPDFELPLPLV